MSIQNEIDRIAGAKTTLGNYLQQNGVAVPQGAMLDTMALLLADVIEKQDKITASGILKGDGAGGVSAAAPGTDYLTEAPVTSVNGKVGAVEIRAVDVGVVSTANVTQTLGSSATKVPSEKAVSDALSSIDGLSIRGGINSIGSSLESVAINPAVNGLGFARMNGATVKIFYDGYEMPVDVESIDNLFDGKFGTYINFTDIQGDFEWNSTKTYPKGAYVTAPSTGRWYKAAKESTNAPPVGDTTGAWEFAGLASSGSYAKYLNLEGVTIEIDITFTQSIRYENSLSLYWRANGQNPQYLKVEKYDSNAGWFEVYENASVRRGDTINNIWMGVDPDGAGTQKRLRITFRAQTGAAWCALTQVAITGIRGGIEGTLLNRGGDTMFGDISPYKAGAASLGTVGAPWKEVHAQSLYGNASDAHADFSTASTRANIATGEKLSIIFGKIAKWFNDLGSLAFKSKVAKSDLSDEIQSSLDKADTALQEAPVTSVNGKTGTVTIAEGTPVTQYSGTLMANSWAEDAYGYQAQTITITGLKASYAVDPQWDVALSGTDPDADAALLEGFALIHNYKTGANSLTAQCIGSAPTVNIPVKVVVFG